MDISLRCAMPVGLLPGHVLFLKVHTACVNCTYSVHRSFTFPLLYLLGCSANVALVYFGGKSKRVQSFPKALLLGTDID